MFGLLKSRLVKCARCSVVIEENESNVGLCNKCDYDSREKHKLYQKEQFNKIVDLLDDKDIMKIAIANLYWNRACCDNLEQFNLIIENYKRIKLN